MLNIAVTYEDLQQDWACFLNNSRCTQISENMVGRNDKTAPKAITEHVVTTYHPYHYHDNNRFNIVN
jgi:hypothetical protein